MRQMSDRAQKDREQMTIGRIAEAAGVAATTLRYYEREGILHPGGRSPLARVPI